VWDEEGRRTSVIMITGLRKNRVKERIREEEDEKKPGGKASAAEFAQENQGGRTGQWRSVIDQATTGRQNLIAAIYGR
jgi:hypothetical protein